MASDPEACPQNICLQAMKRTDSPQPAASFFQLYQEIAANGYYSQADDDTPPLESHVERPSLDGADDRLAHDAPFEMIPRSYYDSNDTHTHDVASLDGLIDDLASEDDGIPPPGVEEKGRVDGYCISEDLLQTSKEVGLCEAEIEKRRRQFGFNRLKQERQNHVKDIAKSFVGPVQCVMEVCSLSFRLHNARHLLHFRLNRR